jgi:hypothetical protein
VQLVDVLCGSGIVSLPSTQLLAEHSTRTGALVRACDLVNVADSVLCLPGVGTPQRWPGHTATRPASPVLAARMLEAVAA